MQPAQVGGAMTGRNADADRYEVIELLAVAGRECQRCGDFPVPSGSPVEQRLDTLVELLSLVINKDDVTGRGAKRGDGLVAEHGFIDTNEGWHPMTEAQAALVSEILEA